MQDEIPAIVPLDKCRPESEVLVWYPGSVSRVRVGEANFAYWQALDLGRLARHCVVGNVGTRFVDGRAPSEATAVATMQDPLVSDPIGHPVSGHTICSPLS